MPPFRTTVGPALYRDLWGESIDKQHRAVEQAVSAEEAQKEARWAARSVRLEQQQMQAAAAAAAPLPSMRSMASSHHAVEVAPYKEQSDVQGIVPGYQGHIPRSAHTYGETAVGGLLDKHPKRSQGLSAAAAAFQVQQLEIELQQEREKLSGLEKFYAVKKQQQLIG